MLETPEQIQYTLDMAGEDITFLAITSTVNNITTTVREAFAIRAIPGQVTYNVQGYESPADADKQDIVFQIVEKDFVNNNINEQDLFTYTHSNTTKTFTFKINSYFPDYTGWMRTRVTLESIT